MQFLKYVKADFKESLKDFGDTYVGQFQESVKKVKESLEMEDKFMTLELLLRDEWKAGREEGREEGRQEMSQEMILNFLRDFGEVPDTLKEKITATTDVTILNQWVKLAARACSIEDFQKQIQ